MVTVKTGNTLIHTLLDTGSSISCLQYEFYENSDLADIPLNPSRLRFRTALGKNTNQTMGIIRLSFVLGTKQFTHEFHVIKDLVKNRRVWTFSINTEFN